MKRKLCLAIFLFLFSLFSILMVANVLWNKTPESETISPITTTYTYNSFSTCSGNNCIVIVRPYAHDIDNKWKPIEEAYSLRNSSVACNVVSDKENLIECVDWNTTHMTVSLSLNESAASLNNIPIRIWDEEKSLNYSIAIKFDSRLQRKNFTLPFRMGYVIEFGKNSSLVNLTTGTSYTLPSNWNRWNNKIECVGAGGNGKSGSYHGGGGGGGGYAYYNNLSATNLVAGVSVAYQIGTAGGTTGASGTGATWFNATTVVDASGGGTPAGAYVGGAAGNFQAGTSGYSGGLGGDGYDDGTTDYEETGGGGGAAGPNGAGNGGCSGSKSYSYAYHGMCGGKGDGTSGGAGGPEVAEFVNANPGSNGTEWSSSPNIGSGGGSSGSGYGASPANAGFFGGGGGASYAGIGYGRQGVIIITYTPDTVKPYFTTNATNTTLAGQPANFTINVIDAYTLDSASGYIFSTNNTGTWRNASYQAFTGSGTTLTAWNVTTLNSTLDSLVQWRFYANDTSNNWNSSAIYNLTTTDGTPPYFSSNATNTTGAGQSANFTINVTDNANLGSTAGYIFSTNSSGTWRNASYQAFAGTGLTLTAWNVTTLNSTIGALVQWRFYANDTSNNWNSSAIYNLTTTDATPPTYSLNQTNSTTAGSAVKHSLYWTDNAGLSGYIFSFCNGSYSGQVAVPYNWTSSDQESSTKRFNTTATLGGYIPSTRMFENFVDSDLDNNWDEGDWSTYQDSPYTGVCVNDANKNCSMCFGTSNPTLCTMNYKTDIDTSACQSGTLWVFFYYYRSSISGDYLKAYTSADGGSTYQQIWTNTSTGTGGNGTANMTLTNGNITSNFRVEFEASVTFDYDSFVDNVTVGCMNGSSYTPKTEQNVSWTSPYNGIGGADYQNVDKIGAKFTISSYNPSSSNTTYGNNNRPDIEVGFYNGTGYVNGSYCQINNTMGSNVLNTTAWNCSINKTDSQFLNSWKYSANRSVIIRGIFLDANTNIIYDEINVTGVYGYVDGWNLTNVSYSCSNANAVLTNDTWVAMTETGNWSNVTKVVNSTVGATIRWCVYANDTTNNWNGTSCSSPFSYTTADTTPTIVSKGNDAYALKMSSDGSTLKGYINNIEITAPVSAPTTWHHYVLTYDGSNQKLYVDGVLVNSTSLAGAINTNANNLKIGEYFSGAIDEVKIYNRSLSADEVKADYELGIKKLSSTGRTDLISTSTNVYLVLANPNGHTHFLETKIQTNKRMMRLSIPYWDIDLDGTARFSKGNNQLTVENKGFNTTLNRPIIELTIA